VEYSCCSQLIIEENNSQSVWFRCTLSVLLRSRKERNFHCHNWYEVLLSCPHTHLSSPVVAFLISFCCCPHTQASHNRIWGSLSGSYECCHLLGYNTVYSVCEPTGHLLHAGSLLGWFWSWRWRGYVPPKRRLTYWVHDAISQKMATNQNRAHLCSCISQPCIEFSWDTSYLWIFC
jgi:hypothetical protein